MTQATNFVCSYFLSASVSHLTWLTLQVRLGQRSSSEVPPVPCKVHSSSHVCLRYQSCEKPALDMWLIAYIVCTAQCLHKWMDIGMAVRAAEIVTGILAYTEIKRLR